MATDLRRPQLMVLWWWLLLLHSSILDLQGSWICSLRGDCSWAILHNSNISPITMLRLLRFFRIMWILKHIKFMRISTLLGGLAVSRRDTKALCACRPSSRARRDRGRQQFA